MSHGHGDNPYLGHHWENMEQQFSGAKLGMWLFMAQEILFFAGLFCFYAVLRYNNPEAFDYGHQLLSTKWGAINTVVLLLSSLTMALGVRAAQLSQHRALCLYLALTFLGGCGFMVIKGFEYASKGKHGSLWGLATFKGEDRAGFDYVHLYKTAETGSKEVARAEKPKVGSDQPQPAIAPTGVASDALAHADDTRGFFMGTIPELPGAHGEPAEDKSYYVTPADSYGPPPPSAHRFFSCYFGLTALHGLHVIVGMGLIAWIFINATRKKYTSKYFTQVEMVGLYWHLVDLIWIFLFPLLYLIE